MHARIGSVGGLAVARVFLQSLLEFGIDRHATTYRVQL